jgi:hypothetical protein
MRARNASSRIRRGLAQAGVSGRYIGQLDACSSVRSRRWTRAPHVTSHCTRWSSRRSFFRLTMSAPARWRNQPPLRETTVEQAPLADAPERRRRMTPSTPLQRAPIGIDVPSLSRGPDPSRRTPRRHPSPWIAGFQPCPTAVGVCPGFTQTCRQASSSSPRDHSGSLTNQRWRTARAMPGQREPEGTPRLMCGLPAQILRHRAKAGDEGGALARVEAGERPSLELVEFLVDRLLERSPLVGEHETYEAPVGGVRLAA